MRGKKGAAAAQELTLSSLGKGGQSDWKQQHWEAAVSAKMSRLAEWKQKPFTRARCFPDSTALGTAKYVCRNWEDQTTGDLKRHRIQVFGLTTVITPTLCRSWKLSGSFAARSPPKTRTLLSPEALNRSAFKATVFAKAGKLFSKLQQRGVCKGTVYLIAPLHGLDLKGSHKQTAWISHISAEIRDASPTAFFLSPTRNGQQATSVCMAANYVGHLPSRTDLDNTMGYILSEINCS